VGIPNSCSQERKPQPLRQCPNNLFSQGIHSSQDPDHSFRHELTICREQVVALQVLCFTYFATAIIYLPNQSQRMTRQRWRVFILGIQQSRQQEGSRHDGQRFQMIPSNVAGRSGQRILDAFFLSSFA